MKSLGVRVVLVGLWSLASAACGSSPILGDGSVTDIVGDQAHDGAVDHADSGPTCSAGQVVCAGSCVDTQNDRDNCGACGTACPGDQVCVAGSCSIACPTGQVACGTACVSEMTDLNNCGACGHACATGLVCSAGACTLACGGALVRCGGGGDAAADAGSVAYCADTQNDRLNCGACGNACPAGNVCTAGSCALSCVTGETPCGTECVTLASDRANCGACGVACAAGLVCSAGVCQLSCAAGLTECSAAVDGGVFDGGSGPGFCADTATDRANCGTCGNACLAGYVCVVGTCQINCPAADTACGTDCTNVQTDRLNCGTCGTICPGGAVCSAGLCGTSCGGTLALCGTGAGTYCANLSSDDANCGACGTICAAGTVCTGGGCGTTCGAPSSLCGTGPTAYCANFQTDNANCGACGTTCAAGTTCTAAVCGLTCGVLSTCGIGAAAYCANLQTDNANCGTCGASCPSGTVCSGGACGTTCAAPLATCGTAPAMFCANTSVDPANCGSCGTMCALPNVAADGCAAGACTVIACVVGFGDCDATAANGCETDTRTSQPNCGACGRACSIPNATSACSSGVCGLTACNVGFANCDGDVMNGCEANTATDNTNCGGCGLTCPAGQVCSGGTCATSCAAPLMTCGSAPSSFCANTGVDPANCGSCGNACALPNVASDGCAGGSCLVVRCNANFGDCNNAPVDGCEASLMTDVANCGVCGHTCAAGQGCATGACVCPGSGTLCGGVCTNTGTDVSNCGGCGHVCSLPNATSSCGGGACAVATCAAGFVDCDHNPANGCEVNTRVDSGNCGGCGTVCASGTVCSGGTCTTTCAPPLATCGTAPATFCADTIIDPANCGACGHVCALSGVAVDGCGSSACTIVTCSAGLGDCDHAAADGCETNTQTSAANCGACGHVCALPNATSSCTVGSCAISTCTAGFADCDHIASNGCEVNTHTDNVNCGACGTTCASGSVCSGGVCGTTCAPPLATCGTAPATFCANTAVDPANCGVCGHACALPNAATDACAGGACTVASCNAGFGNCNGVAADGCETNLLSDTANCGACAHACALANSTSACGGGACAVAACNTGFADCNHNPADGCEVNTGTDFNNCGGCGVMCAAGHLCSAGACVTTCAPPLTVCATFCTNLADDPANCGTCGHACPVAPNATPACGGSACGYVCNAHFADCNSSRVDGCESNSLTDNNNCGGCGVVCSASQHCASGTCVASSASVQFPLASDPGSAMYPPYYWNAGDQTTGVRVTALASSTSATIHLVIASDVLSCDTQDTAFMINGVVVGTFSIHSAEASVDQTFLYPVKAGTTYTLEYRTTRTVNGGCGAASYDTSGASTVVLFP